MIIVQYYDHFLYTNKRDIFLLQLSPIKNNLFRFDESYADENLNWFKENNIHFEKVVSTTVLMGWTGLYYVDFKGWDDPMLTQYTKKFENEDGMSLNPEKYQMLSMSYEQWINEGRLIEYEKLLKDIEDGTGDW